jgi:hypothetical protein
MALLRSASRLRSGSSIGARLIIADASRAAGVLFRVRTSFFSEEAGAEINPVRR